LFERGLVWELEADDSLEEEEELSSSLSLFICRVDKRGILSVLAVRVRGGRFVGRLLVEMTDDEFGDFTGFIVASFAGDWF
jgi:hypothetical protein